MQLASTNLTRKCSTVNPEVLFTIMCVRTQKFLPYASLRFFVRAIHRQFLTIVLRARAHDILFIECLLQWACSLSSVFGLSVYFLNVKICNFHHVILSFFYLKVHFYRATLC